MKEIKELLELIAKSHGWKNMYKNHMENKKHRLFKYVDFSLDTRDMEIWNVTFRGMGESKSFVIETLEDFKNIIDWLEFKGEK